MRLVGDGGDGVDERWRTAVAGADDDVKGPERLASVVRQAAGWTAEKLGRTHRLGAVVIGIDDSICARVSAPSPVREVVAAALDQRQREWSSELSASSVQALAPPASNRLSKAARKVDAPSAVSNRLTVLEGRDGRVRLWLDALDRLGVNPDSVLTLWHALVAAWASPATGAHDDRVVGVVLVASDRVVWSWSRGGDLLAGGWIYTPPSDSAETPTAALPNRLGLDWLAWAAQLEVSPELLEVVAAEPKPIADALTTLWPGARINSHCAEDPLAQTLVAVATEPREADDARRCVVDLSHRPGRAHRRLAIWTSGAIVLFAAAITGVGVRQRMAIAQTKTLASELRAHVVQSVSAVDPALAQDVDPVRALRSLLASEREAHQPIDSPTPPRQIFLELSHLGDAIAKALGDRQLANVRSIKLDEVSGEVDVFVPDFVTGENILSNLQSTPGPMRWQGKFIGPKPPTTQRLRATWKGDE